ncbi:hypothetical protein V5799_004267 [Amblyomma americanum]|uniref:L27 domain-containing protein n=1 Tax=Amblyomma americanum TaxID=6943 RepID=A0AAQ4D6L4_AMBAM
MPVRKQGEAHRALELLEEYHSKLSKPQDKQLRNAIERVIRIFKSRLFQALLDIQEFYEITLLDDTKSIQQKTAETLQIACKWENSPPITGTHSNSTEVRPPVIFLPRLLLLYSLRTVQHSGATQCIVMFYFARSAQLQLSVGTDCTMSQLSD